MPLELRLALSPGQTFRRLVADDDRGGWRTTAGPIVFSALLLGVTVAASAARWVSLELVATTTLSFAFVLLLQVIAASAVIFTARRRRVSVARALELFFRGHAPWTFWLFVASAAAIAFQGGFQVEALIITLPIPGVWTGIIVAAFSRAVLGTGRGEAVVRAVVHQAIVWAMGLSYIAWAAGGWMRIVEALAG